MPSESPQPQLRRRTRTGCLTCRSRRRKCDGARPTCANCGAKNLVCRYGSNFTFVAAKPFRNSQGHSNKEATTIRSNSRARLAADVNGVSSSRNRSVVLASRVPESEPTTLVSAIDDDTGLILDETEGHLDDVTNFDGDDNNLVDGDIDMPSTSLVERGLESNGHLQVASVDHIHVQTSARQTESQISISIDHAVAADDEEQYELDLLHHYRYRVAPVLDLEIGYLNCGVGAMLLAKESSQLYDIIVAVASCHRAATKEEFRKADKSMYARYQIDIDAEDHIVPQDQAEIRLVMSVLVVFISKHPRIWLREVRESVSAIVNHNISSEGRVILSRFILAATVMDISYEGRSEMISHFLTQCAGLFDDVETNYLQQALHIALVLLERSLDFSQTTSCPGRHLLHTWQTCWRTTREWYVGRNIEMCEILQLSATCGDTQSEDRDFPLILFSNACATLANTVHHLTALLLLQDKPRLIKPSIRHDPSTSLIWHVQCIMGISDAAIDGGFWDPLMVSAVVYAAKLLSHDKQRRSAGEILRKFANASGFNLENDIATLVGTNIAG